MSHFYKEVVLSFSSNIFVVSSFGLWLRVSMFCDHNLFGVLFVVFLPSLAATSGKLLDPMAKKHKVSFPWTQRYIASSGSEPGSWQPFDQ